MADTKTKKKTEKKDENFLSRAAHSIRDKVHGLTDDIKEKTHHKLQENDSKKSKKHENGKKTPSPRPNDTKHDDHKRSDSEDEDYDKPTPPITSSKKTDNPINYSSTNQNVKDLAAKPDSSTATANNKTTNNVSFKEPPVENIEKKQTNETPSKTTNTNTSEKVHLSFDGIVTVDDLLNRIDETVENSKIVIENGKENTAVNIQQTQKPTTRLEPSNNRTPTVSQQTTTQPSASRETVGQPAPIEQSTGKHSSETDLKNENEPIRLNYSDIHTIGDILIHVDDQPGNRRIVLENAPNTNTTGNENKDPTGAPKSILKSSQDPSSADTSTKVTALDDNQIHVDLGGVQKFDDLLDRIDETVEKVPIIIETSLLEPKKTQAPPPLQTTNDQPKKNEEKSVSNSNEQKKNDADVPTFHVAEHEFGQDETPAKQTTTQTAEHIEWI